MLKRTQYPRSMEELLDTEELKNLKVKVITKFKDTLCIIVPRTGYNTWMFQRIIINSINTIGLCLCIRIPRKLIVRDLRRLHNQIPFVFGYAMKSPVDRYDLEFAKRVAMERLIDSINRNSKKICTASNVYITPKYWDNILIHKKL